LRQQEKQAQQELELPALLEQEEVVGELELVLVLEQQV
jgi:hypothetical protein